MNILLLSDTHGELEETLDIIRQYPKMDYYLHLGDIGFPLQELHKFLMVKGNHDRDCMLPYERYMQIEKRHILYIHGNLFDEETMQEVLAMPSIDREDIMAVCMHTLYKKLAAYALQKGCDTLFFGHTHHQVDIEVDGVRLINPGSVCFGTPHSGYAVIEILGSTLHCTFHESKGIM